MNKLKTMIPNTKSRYIFIRLLLCTVLLTACSQKETDENFTGYLVAKEYTPKRMCHDNTKTLCYASFAPQPVVHINPPPHHHSKQNAEYYFYLANKKEVVKKAVTPKLFYSRKVGTKITIKL